MEFFYLAMYRNLKLQISLKLREYIMENLEELNKSSLKK